jgi:hypothetical protein
VPSHQKVTEGLWVLHHEKIRINGLVKAVGSPEHIRLAFAKALNHYRDGWHSGRAYQRESARKLCEAGFQRVEELIESWKRDPTPPRPPGSRRTRRSV